ncbi:salicylate 1-monooxygenase SalA [Colletotrichum truncatum]|uniref:Salicylate 1-monooxygenase SalA n=1 Tax=Colletotrichum truncatum TaxID=5467 RepID=A0ACC3YDV8_COLTU|nr:salicylate 1-monooxygenase SalA [Colletotrichum truncatum]KAF6791083.1 salicylate 1-monooxygenase SalA [Colletotrichum truncatum]
MANSNNNGNGVAPSLEVAIVGGGVVGVITALGLRRRGIKAVIYERAPTWHEVSAGFAFTGAARVWMEMLDPALVELLGNISQKTDANTSNAYWNGYHPRTREESEDESKSLLFRTPTNNLSFWGCVRSQFLQGMADLLPEGAAKFGKQLVSYDDDHESGKVVLHFDDGSTAEADVLLGCDGIHSATRKFMLGADHPASRPGFSHTVVYRTMVPIEEGIAALGNKVAKCACNHLGPNADLLVYPVMSGTLLNIAVFAYEESEFPDPDKMIVPAEREEIKELFKGWSPQVADIWKLYPEKLVKWGIFDLENNPPPTYATGRACLVGDAAHASTPYMGVGACTGVEDSLVICTLLESVQQKALSGDELREALAKALQTYNSARLERGRWIHHHSRQMGQMYHWRYGPTGRDPQRMKQKLEENWGKVVSYDIFAPLEPEIRELAMSHSAVAVA